MMSDERRALEAGMLPQEEHALAGMNGKRD